MPSNAQMRQAVYNAYSSVSWHDKVNKMPDRQVFAVYKRLVAQGVIKN